VSLHIETEFQASIAATHAPEPIIITYNTGPRHTFEYRIDFKIMRQVDSGMGWRRSLSPYNKVIRSKNLHFEGEMSVIA
jgi:hypothetical protein